MIILQLYIQSGKEIESEHSYLANNTSNSPKLTYKLDLFSINAVYLP